MDIGCFVESNHGWRKKKIQRRARRRTEEGDRFARARVVCIGAL
jgi:hypothetical protein